MSNRLNKLMGNRLNRLLLSATLVLCFCGASLAYRGGEGLHGFFAAISSAQDSPTEAGNEGEFAAQNEQYSPIEVQQGDEVANDKVKADILSYMSQLENKCAEYTVFIETFIDNVKSVYFPKMSASLSKWTGKLQTLIDLYDEALELPKHANEALSFFNEGSSELLAVYDEARRYDANERAYYEVLDYAQTLDKRGREYADDLRENAKKEIRDVYIAKLDSVNAAYIEQLQALCDECYPVMEFPAHKDEAYALIDKGAAELDAVYAEALAANEKAGRVEVSDDGDGYVEVACSGELDADDLLRIVAHNPVGIDLTGITNETLPDDVFAGMRELAVVKWNGVTKVGALGCGNPNLLFYCPNEAVVPSDVRNVVVNGKAESITLETPSDETMKKSRGNYYCPEEFTAQRISYEHSYGMKTGRGDAAGWETLALPFDVQSVYNNTKQTEVVPFRRYDKTEVNGSKPFWLYSYHNDEFVPVSSILANKPYIISMPNNDAYLAEFNISGEVTFSAENVTVPQTVLQSDGGFVAALTGVDAANDVYAINKYEVVDGCNEGSVFVRGLRDVRPFEAYFKQSDSQHRIIEILRKDDSNADVIEEVRAADNNAARYNLQGQKVGKGYRGIIIVNAKKLIMK